MKLEYIGHACFRLELDNGFAWVTDPYDGSIGLERPSVSATVTTLSHGHFDHNCVKALDGAVAAKVAAAIAARTVVPMHFNVPRLKLDIAGPEAFIEAMGGAYARAGSVLDVKSAPAGVVLMTPSR